MAGHYNSLEAPRLIWRTWQRHGLQANDPVLKPIPLNALPSTNLGARTSGIYEQPCFSFTLHLVLPSAAQVTAFDDNDVVDESILQAAGHPHARPDAETVLVTPLLAVGIQSYALLESACSRGIEDADAWRALSRVANPPGWEFSQTHVPAVWFVQFLYGHVAPGTVVEHVDGRRRPVCRHFAVVTKALMRIEERVFFEAKVMDCVPLNCKCMIVVPLRLVEDWVLRDLRESGPTEFHVAYIDILRQGTPFESMGVIRSSVCALPVATYVPREEPEHPPAVIPTVNAKRNPVRRILRWIFRSKRPTRHSPSSPVEAFRTVHTSVMADDGTVVTDIGTASADATSLTDAVASTSTDNALDVSSDKSVAVGDTSSSVGEECVSVSCGYSIMEEAV